MADHAAPSVYTVMQELEWCGNRDGQTPLCLAAQLGQQQTVALVRHTPGFVCCSYKSLFLRSHQQQVNNCSAYVSPFMHCLSLGITSTTQAYVRKKGRYQTQPLTSVCVQLIRKGANINACSSRRDGGTPLHEAAATVRIAIAQMLMAAGANPFVENHHGVLPGTRCCRPLPSHINTQCTQWGRNTGGPLEQTGRERPPSYRCLTCAMPLFSELCVLHRVLSVRPAINCTATQLMAGQRPPCFGHGKSMSTHTRSHNSSPVLWMHFHSGTHVSIRPLRVS